MDNPLVVGPAVVADEDVAEFFKRDTSRRLQRAVELSLCYAAFFCLLYVRLLIACTETLWLAVFLPLLVLDVRNVQHAWYLHVSKGWFTPLESVRYSMLFSSECIVHFMLCAYLMSESMRQIPMKVIVLPFAIGYVSRFVLGQFVPLEEAEELQRPQSFNAVAGLISELARFLEFVVLIAVAWKVDGTWSAGLVTWAKALWPIWGLEGIIVVMVLLALPFCLASCFTDPRRMRGLAWVALSCGGFSTALAVSVFNSTSMLDNHKCSVDGSMWIDTPACVTGIQLTIFPWIVFLPGFALATLLMRRSLTRWLHESWYHGPWRDPEQPVRPVIREPPEVMFRVTGTYYTREPYLDDGLWGADDFSNAAPVPLDSQCSMSSTTMATRQVAAAVESSTSSDKNRSSCAHIDPMESTISAIGGTYAEFVESEGKCFICYDNSPNAILLECGHAGICEECAVRMMGRADPRCSVCRCHISQVVKFKKGAPPSGLFMPHTLAFPKASTKPDVLEAQCSRLQPRWPHLAEKMAVAVEAVCCGGRDGVEIV